MNSLETKTQTDDFYHRATQRPALVLTLGLILLLITLAGLPRLTKDTSISAFIPDDHPSLAANESVKETFGLADTVAIAVVLEQGGSVFPPEVLALIDSLSQRLADVPNLREDRVASITTESSISGDNGAIDVRDYLPWFEGDVGKWTQEDTAAAAEAQSRWQTMPPHQSTLVSDDARAAIIMAEMRDEGESLDTWKAVAKLVEEHSAQSNQAGAELLLAGPGAVSGYFSAYINKDVRVLLPAGFLFVLLFVYLAFLRAKALLGPLLIIVATVGGALGIMGWMGIDYFAITNALPVILVAIAVADAIHVLSAYYVERAAQPDVTARVLVVDSMRKMTRPILLTSATTIAGFIGLGTVSIMPPITFFAWYAALGVALACAYTLLVLPSLLVLLDLPASPAFAHWRSRTGSFNETKKWDWIGRSLLWIGQFARRRALYVVGGFALAGFAAAMVAGDLKIDRSQVENFRPDEPLRVADERINSIFAGTSFLNVVVESAEPGGLLGREQMQAVSDLQAAFTAMPGVQKTISIADYLSVLHAAINEQPILDERQLPKETDALEQYLLVYESSGSPTDFEEEISSDHSSLLIRGFLNKHRFSETRTTVEALMAYLDAQQPALAALGLKAQIAGDVNIAYHWMTRLVDSHFYGIGLALCLVLVMASIMFRSAFMGVLAVVPVALTVLSVYGVMSVLGIYLDPPSSMFAAIAIGVGVDFSIHLLARLRELGSMPLEQALNEALPETARACLFNALALAVGFSVMMLSLLPTLQRFGGFIALAAAVSFLAALLLVPAMMSLAIRFRASRASSAASGGVIANTARTPTGVLVIAAAIAGPTTEAYAANVQGMTGLAVATRVAERAEGRASKRSIQMQLTDKRGRSRERSALVVKNQMDGVRYTRVTYLSPKPVREVSFLSHDKLTPGATDDRWLYLPATRKVRRVPASDRGDYFLGTDFSYEDMQSELKFALQDYDFTLVESADAKASGHFRLRGTPKTKAVVRELGYGAFEANIDPATWMPLQIDFFDPRLKPLKSVTVTGISQVDGVWNAGSIECTNHRTGHTTLFNFSDIEYRSGLPDKLFVPEALSRGAPQL